jgi:dimeric dUTPase (all-alpha-NTP-PPase superfamily)
MTTALPSSAGATSDLFKPNPLTNSALEQIRIWNQDEADNIKYGGELESGSSKPGAFEQYVDLLQPILQVQSDLATINQLIIDCSNDKKTKEEYITIFQNVNEILSQDVFDKIKFKKAFNAFADNIYYSDPDRANLYLGGGAVPQSTQTIAYLLRNDVLTNVEDMRE